MAWGRWGRATSTMRAPAPSRRAKDRRKAARVPSSTPRSRNAQGTPTQRPRASPARSAAKSGTAIEDAGGVAGIAPAEHAGGEGHVFDRARERADLVERGREGHHAVAADAAVGRLEPDDAAQGRGLADRSAGVGAQGERRHPRGYGRGRAPGGAAGHARRVPGVAGLLVGAVLRGRAHRELVHVGLGQHDRALRLEPGDRRGREGRTIAFEDARAAGRCDALEIEDVLQDHGDAGQSRRRRSRGERRVELSGLRQGPIRQQGEQGLDPGLDRGHAVEVGAGHLFGRNRARHDPPPDLGGGETPELAHPARMRGTRKRPSAGSGAAANRGLPGEARSRRVLAEGLGRGRMAHRLDSSGVQGLEPLGVGEDLVELARKRRALGVRERQARQARHVIHGFDGDSSHSPPILSSPEAAGKGSRVVLTVGPCST